MPNNRIRPRNRHDFKIAIICALPLEASIVNELFDAQWDTEEYGKEQVDTNAYSLGAFGSHNVALVHMPNMGKVAAATAAANLRASFPGIQLALVVGICGGAPFGPSGELLLGDVVISEGLVQYDLGRRLPHAFVRKNTPVENLPRPRPEVRAILAKLQTSQGRYQLQKGMLEHLRLLRHRSDLTIPYPGPMNDKLFEPMYLHRHNFPSECEICANVDGDILCSLALEASCEELGCIELDPRPRSRLLQTLNESQPIIHFGLVATGDTVMRSGKDRDKIVARDKVVAFEMEGAGVWEIFPAALVIKGVCDYADSHKNKSWQAYAAATAATAAKAFLEQWSITLSIPSSSPLNFFGGYAGYKNMKQFEPRELAIMKRLNTSPYRDRKERNPDRVAGTCEWFIQHPLFQGWKESTSSRLLWVSADPGCGKSVLVKYLIDHVLLTTPSKTVCYFFFKDDFEDQKSIVSALCCMLYQLFQQNPALLSEAIANQFEAGGDRFFASFSELWHILLTAAQDIHSREIICILDAIDECEDHGRSQLAKELCKLYGAESRLNLKFLVTSRPFGKIRQGFQPLQIPSLPIIHLSGESEQELKKISAEIDTYIKARVQDISQRLYLKPEERQTLLKELLQVPNRTYLWVYLILDLVESNINIDRTGILQATAHIPRTVDEAYNKILSKSSDFGMATKILHIILAAERALTLTELGFALAIRSCHRSCDEIDIKSEDRLRENIRDACGLFVTIIHSKVYLLHQTAREFLVCNTDSQSNSSIKWKHMLLPQASHNILATICIRYLLMSDHNINPSKDDETQSDNSRVLLDYSANYWVTHFRESPKQVNKSMTKLILKICDANSTRCKVWLRNFWKKTNTTFPKKFTTLMVVSYFGLDEAVKMMLSSMTDDVELNNRDQTYKRSALSWAAGSGFDLVVKLLARGHNGWYRRINLLLFGNDIEINSVDASGRTPLVYAIWNGNVAVVEALIKAGAKVDLTDDIGGTPLFYAMTYRREAIVKLLLTHEATPKPEHDMAARLFFSAVEQGDVQAVQLFLDSGMDIESRERDNMTPLLLAVEQGHLNITQLLLKHGANVEPEGTISRPLFTAVERKDPETVQLLLDHGANTESTSKVGDTPLLAAVKNLDADTAQLLLDHGANTEAMFDRKYTALFYAVMLKITPIVRALLHRGADIGGKDGPLATKLMLLATKGGHLDLIQILLDRGASLDSPNEHGSTPLMLAAKNNRLDVVQFLLNQGASIEDPRMLLLQAMEYGAQDIAHFLLNQKAIINALDGTGCTHLAVVRGYEKAVRFLIDQGIDINAPDNRNETPLHYAVKHERSNIVRLLLNNGAHIEARDDDGRTPLGIAATHVFKWPDFRGHIEMDFYTCIELLLDRGANIDAVDSYVRTPLYYAIKERNEHLIEFLLNRGADIQFLDKRTQHLLHLIRGGNRRYGVVFL